MKTFLKISVAFALMLSALGLATPVALAAAPSNDTSANATVATIGFSETIDTTEATTDADDAQLNEVCGAPATDASVWYVLEGSDQGVIVDVSQSDYSAGVLVGTGSPGNLSLVTCGPGTVSFFAAAGTTYYILAIDDQLNGDGLNGGNLSISFTEAPPPPTLDFTVNPYGKVNSRTGVATISGTYSCTDADFIDLFISASQSVGRFTINGTGEFFDFSTCDGTTHTWSAQVYPENGKFAGGKAMTFTFAYACGAFECASGYIEQIVKLRGGK